MECKITIWSAPEAVEWIPSRAREVYDVSGAGDTVSAVPAVTLAGSATRSEAASLANFAAGLSAAQLESKQERVE